MLAGEFSPIYGVPKLLLDTVEGEGDGSDGVGG